VKQKLRRTISKKPKVKKRKLFKADSPKDLLEVSFGDSKQIMTTDKNCVII